MNPIVAKPKRQRLILLEFVRQRCLVLTTLAAVLREAAEQAFNVSSTQFSMHVLGVFILLACMILLCTLFSSIVRKESHADSVSACTDVMSRCIMLLFLCCVYGIMYLKLANDFGRVPLIYVLLGPIVAGIFPICRGVAWAKTAPVFLFKCTLMFGWTISQFSPDSNAPIILISSKKEMWLELLQIVAMAVLALHWQFHLTICASASTWRLSKRNRFLQVTLDSSDAIMWQLDSKMRFKHFLGKQGTRLFSGAVGNEIEESMLAAGFDGAELDRICSMHKHVLETGESCEYILPKDVEKGVRHVARNHTYKVKLSPLLNSCGTCAAVVGVSIFVDDMIEAQERQRQSEQLYRTMVHAIADNIIQIDREGTMLFMNRRLFDRGQPCDANMAPAGVKELIGKNFFSSLVTRGEEHRNYVRKAFEAAFAEAKIQQYDWVAWKDEAGIVHGKPTPQEASVDQFPAGARFFFMRFLPLLVNGEVESILLLTQDVTERFLAQLEQRKAEEARIACNAKSQFLSILSHELRNPLTIIVGSIEALFQPQSQLTTWQEEQVHNAMNSSKHLLGILNDVMLAEKAQARSITILPESVDTVELVEGAAQSIRATAAAKGLRVLCNIDPTLPKSLLLDSLRINQVFSNLLGNAVKFTKSGYICLSAQLLAEEHDKVTVKFSCEDTGIGIRAEDARRVFQHFQQIEDGTRHILPSNFAGFGIGMPLSRNIVELMGGRLELEKSVHGCGSLFAATLTVAKGNDTTRIMDSFRSFSSECRSAHLAIGCEKLAGIVHRYLELMHVKCVENVSAADVLLLDDANSLSSSATSPHKIIRFTNKTVTSTEHSGNEVEIMLPIRLYKLAQVLCTDETVPRQLSPRSIQPGDLQATPALINRAKTILICEDVKIIQKLLISFLNRLGFKNVACADDGQQAVDIFSQHPAGHFGLVLMDLQMPRLDGFEATRRIREIEKNSSATTVPIICLTANDKQQTQDKCREVGFSTIVNKPCTMQDLFEAIKLVLEG